MTSRSDGMRLYFSMKKPTWLWWSTGKDSAWTLHELRERSDFEVTRLITTVTERFGRVSMHATREALLREQARVAGLPLRVIRLPYPCPNEKYEAAVAPMLEEARGEGVAFMAFGDLHLEDVRAYREELLSGSGIEPIFPLWKRDTQALATEMVASGLRAQITCIDPEALPRTFAGKTYDKDFLASLPEDVDPCGENGEFHTFCWDGPMFERPIPVVVGKTVERDSFVFTDVIPQEMPDNAT